MSARRYCAAGTAGAQAVAVIKNIRVRRADAESLPRSPFVIVWRDQVADGCVAPGTSKAAIRSLVAPVSLCDTFMLAQMF